MAVIDRITNLLRSSGQIDGKVPPTTLYNEGWMLRLVLDWFERHPSVDHPLHIAAKDRWYSEARVPSAFLPRFRGDRFAESWTHADAVIGDVAIGRSGQADLSIDANCGRMIVVEAKMFSPLSAGVTRARYFDQAARNVACMAEVLRRASRKPAPDIVLGFTVLAPESQIRNGVFASFMTKESIASKVERRVAEHEEPPREWYRDWFLPVLDAIALSEVSWEDVVRVISAHDSQTGAELSEFYDQCLIWNAGPDSGLRPRS